MKIIAILLFSIVASFALVYVDAGEGDEVVEGILDSIEDNLGNLLKKKSLARLGRRGYFSCKNADEKCGTTSRCCGELKCYWEDGYSALKKGICVTCIKRTEVCQLDSACCSGLVCQKGGAGYVDGTCDFPKPSGGSCHEDDQCASKDCNITKMQRLKFQDGTCA